MGYDAKLCSRTFWRGLDIYVSQYKCTAALANPSTFTTKASAIPNMSVFYYDPFYDVERMINDTFGRMGNTNTSNQSQALQRHDGNNDVQRAIRPR
jgi:hypothetical protein